MPHEIPEDEFEDFYTPPPIVESSNPLSSFFRLPGLSVKLPTNGGFMPKGTIELDDLGEVSVRPMRSQDELLLSSPDALMNNHAITSLIESCVPRIKNARYVSMPDLDVLLLAIRVASSGEMMETELTCPQCKKQALFEINLPEVLRTAKPVPLVNAVRINETMMVYLRPYTIALQTKMLMAAFKETRLAQSIDDRDDVSEEERANILNGVMARLNDANLEGIAHSVIRVVIPDNEVTDVKYIHEFLAETDKRTLNKIKKSLEDLNNIGVDKNIMAQCNHCKHEWGTMIEFNPATFFAERSSD